MSDLNAYLVEALTELPSPSFTSEQAATATVTPAGNSNGRREQTWTFTASTGDVTVHCTLTRRRNRTPAKLDDGSLDPEDGWRWMRCDITTT